MKFIRVALLFIGLLLITLSSRTASSENDVTSFKTQQYAEFSVGVTEWDGYFNLDGSGIYSELIQKAFPNYRISFVFDSYQANLKKFQQHKIDAIAGIYSDDVTQAIFPTWHLDTEYPVVAFYKADKTRIKHPSELDNLKVAWLQGYRFGHYLNKEKPAMSIHSIDEGFSSLANDTIDVFVDYDYNLFVSDKKNYQQFPILPPRKIYLAFQHNQFGQQLANQYDRQLSTLKKSGYLSTLFGDEYSHTRFSEMDSQRPTIIVYTNSVSLLKNPEANAINVSNSLNLSFILEQLSGFTIEYRLINDMEKIYQFVSQPNVCISDLIKNKQRIQYFYASQPFSLFLGLQLYSTKPLPITQNINLAALLKTYPIYRLGLTSGRTYGEAIDAQLNQVNPMQFVFTPSDVKTLFKQLANNRFDLLIEYPSIKAQYWPAEKPIYQYEIDGSEHFLLGHMMCTKSPLNQQFIRQFNQQLTSLSHYAVFYYSQLNRISTENQPLFKRYFDQAFPLAFTHDIH